MSVSAEEQSADGQSSYGYDVYGVSLRSEFVLSLPEHTHPGLTEIEICAGSPAVFLEAIQGVDLQSRSEWYYYAHLDDRSSYVRWRELGEFLVSSDGRRIICARDAGAPLESFQVYLLGQALGFALVKSGFEPLHATALYVDGEAIALLGGCGFGKSSLAACFLSAGHTLLTDDLLLMQPGPRGFEAYPGPSRIKLFPNVARHFLGHAVGVPMNSETGKLIIPLKERHRRPVTLRAIYALAGANQTDDQVQSVQIEPLSPHNAFLALIGNTFNYLLVDPDRLQRQAVEAARIQRTVPVKKLSYPLGLDYLPSVREAILADLAK